jgi:hypothetical protein
VRPFDFIILFLSFIFTLALTHLLFAATRMIRHRRVLTFSWPHALWMGNAVLMLGVNWLSLWDFHTMEKLSLPVIVVGFLMVALQYFVCALIAPDFEDGESYDMRAFHERESPTYLVVFLLLILLALAGNLAAGVGAGIQNWAAQNTLVLGMVVPPLLALTVRRPWAQLAAPLLANGLVVVFAALYYPVLA